MKVLYTAFKGKNTIRVERCARKEKQLVYTHSSNKKFIS